MLPYIDLYDFMRCKMPGLITVQEKDWSIAEEFFRANPKIPKLPRKITYPYDPHDPVVTFYIRKSLVKEEDLKNLKSGQKLNVLSQSFLKTEGSDIFALK